MQHFVRIFIIFINVAGIYLKNFGEGDRDLWLSHGYQVSFKYEIELKKGICSENCSQAEELD